MSHAVKAVALRICPRCSRPAPCEHDSPRRRHAPVRATRLPSAVDAAYTRAYAEHDQATDAATDALAALRAATEHLLEQAEALVRRPRAEASLRLQGTEEELLRALDTLRSVTGVQP